MKVNFFDVSIALIVVAIALMLFSSVGDLDNNKRINPMPMSKFQYDKINKQQILTWEIVKNHAGPIANNPYHEMLFKKYAHSEQLRRRERHLIPEIIDTFEQHPEHLRIMIETIPHLLHPEHFLKLYSIGSPAVRANICFNIGFIRDTDIRLRFLAKIRDDILTKQETSFEVKRAFATTLLEKNDEIMINFFLQDAHPDIRKIVERRINAWSKFR